MAKSSFYFDHDYNARNDQKILELRAEYGWNGYGIYFGLIEVLCESAGQIKRGALGGLSLGLSIDKKTLEKMLDFMVNIDLLHEENGVIYSNRVNDHLAFRSMLSEAGKRGGRPQNKAPLKPPLSPPESRKGKERKEEERKEEERKEKKNKEKENKEKILENVFDEFRRAYPGTKRGLDTELGNLKKKHDDWQLIIPILENALKMQYFAKEQNRAGGNFVPEWKNLQTYINQRAWEEEIIIQQPKQKQNNGNQSLADKRREADRLLDEMYSKQR